VAINDVDIKSVNGLGENIQEDIWIAFQKEDTISSFEFQDISISVEEGQVFLTGHITRELLFRRLEEIARSVSGVLAVHNHLVTDPDLTRQVARSLWKDEQVRPYSLPVYCYHGWTSLSGEIPSRELQQLAEEDAARVPTVRGVISLPKVKGEQAEIIRPAIQPTIGARVYCESGMMGIVVQVVIRPQNRLVTHAIVRVNQTLDGRLRHRDVLVPVEVINVVSEWSIFLKRDTPIFNAFPEFISADYPIAPLTWEPPYPYKVGRVRWPRKVVSQLGKNNECHKN